jgi:hypothetical protein
MNILTDIFVVPIPFDVLLGKTGICLSRPPNSVNIDNYELFTGSAIFHISGRTFDVGNLGKIVIEKNGETSSTIRFLYIEIDKKRDISEEEWDIVMGTDGPKFMSKAFAVAKGNIVRETRELNERRQKYLYGAAFNYLSWLSEEPIWIEQPEWLPIDVIKVRLTTQYPDRTTETSYQISEYSDSFTHLQQGVYHPKIGSKKWWEWVLRWEKTQPLLKQGLIY